MKMSFSSVFLLEHFSLISVFVFEYAFPFLFLFFLEKKKKDDVNECIT